MSYVTTEGRCSNCDSELRNAETARLNWQEAACELQKQLESAESVLRQIEQFDKGFDSASSKPWPAQLAREYFAKRR